MGRRNQVAAKSEPQFTRVLPGGYIVRTPVDMTRAILPLVLTVEEAAAALLTTPISIRSAIATGELPSIRLGGRDRILTAKLYALFHQAELDRQARVKAREAGGEVPPFIIDRPPKRPRKRRPTPATRTR
jgi:hypothetical protein